MKYEYIIFDLEHITNKEEYVYVNRYNKNDTFKCKILLEFLNYMGNNGWELCIKYYSDEYPTYIFKKTKEKN